MRFEKILSSFLPIFLLETPFLGCEVCAFQFCRVKDLPQEGAYTPPCCQCLPQAGPVLSVSV